MMINGQNIMGAEVSLLDGLSKFNNDHQTRNRSTAC